MAVTRADAGIVAAPRATGAAQTLAVATPRRYAAGGRRAASGDLGNCGAVFPRPRFHQPAVAGADVASQSVRHTGRTGGAAAHFIRNRDRLSCSRPVIGAGIGLAVGLSRFAHRSFMPIILLALRPAAGHDPADLRAVIRHRRGLEDRVRRQPRHVSDHDRGGRRRAEDQSDPSHQRPFDGREPRAGPVLM